MISFPNCKINLGLNILGKRPDGYHNIETIFYPVMTRDALEIMPLTSASADDTENNNVLFSSGGLIIAGDEADNLCVKAYRLLKKDHPALPPVRIHLHKEIPMGAGLGGGSADGAFTLLAINQRFGLGLTTNDLLTYALQLGSDCPFFIINQPAIATGRGERLAVVNLSLSEFQLVVVNPGIHINTGWAFSELDLFPGNKEARPPLQAVLNLRVEEWKDVLKNDFEKPVFTRYPEIQLIRDKFYANGAMYSSMSGSGSSVYALFYKNVKPFTDFPAHYIIKQQYL